MSPPCADNEVETRAPTIDSDRECVAARQFRIVFPVDYGSVAASSVQREAFANNVREELLAVGIPASDILGSLLVEPGSTVVVVNVRDTPDAVDRMQAAIRSRISITVNGALVQSKPPASSSSAPVSAAVAAGAAIGAVVVLAVVVVLVVRMQRKRAGRSGDAKLDGTTTAFENPMYTEGGQTSEEAYDGARALRVGLVARVPRAPASQPKRALSRPFNAQVPTTASASATLKTKVCPQSTTASGARRGAVVHDAPESH